MIIADTKPIAAAALIASLIGAEFIADSARYS
ncbi:hypothetical protein MTBLM5_650003 [Magnetospirillum sp. LM-5]|nr:hypothetical protein MTBLM5_650003 [Magnetospirillum sp. LM-5]